MNQVRVQIDSEDVEKAIRIMMSIVNEYAIPIEEIKHELRIRRILVPTDFSRGSEDACHYAIRLALKLQAEIKLLHVFENPRPVRIVWRLSRDPAHLLRAEVTAERAGVAMGTKRRNARFFFQDAAPPGWFVGWTTLRSMYHEWTCILAQPPGADRETRVAFTIDREGSGWLVTGLDDYAIWASRPPVTLNLRGPGLPEQGVEFVNPNEQGHYVWSIGDVTRGEYTATVSSPTHRQRVFCFDVGVGEPADGQWGQSMGLGM